jgi:hypothetical protein
LLQLFQRISIDFLWQISSLLFPRTMEQSCSREIKPRKGVQDYGRIERGHGSISFIMHHRKPAAVFPASQRALMASFPAKNMS